MSVYNVVIIPHPKIPVPMMGDTLWICAHPDTNQLETGAWL